MAIVYSDLLTSQQNGVSASNRKAGYNHGKLRYITAVYTAPATGMPAIGDVIQFAKLPKGSRLIGKLTTLSWTTGAASCTLNLGDAASAARYLAATAITTAGEATADVVDKTGLTGFVNTADTVIQGVVAGAGIAASQVIVARIAYVQD